MNSDGRLGKERGLFLISLSSVSEPTQDFPNIFVKRGWKSCTDECSGKGTGEVESYRALS